MSNPKKPATETVEITDRTVDTVTGVGENSGYTYTWDRSKTPALEVGDKTRSFVSEGGTWCIRG